jgi:hypothetical protein
MERPRIFDWRTWVVILGFVLSLALVVIFTVRVLRYVHHPQTAEPIRPWMSIPYIAHSYHIPAQDLYQALGLPADRRDRRPIAMIARAQHRSVQSVIQTLYQAIVQANPTYRPPTPAPFEPTGGAP